MLKYEFSLREKILLLILAIFLLGLFYYEVAYVYFKDELKSYDTTALIEECNIEQAKVMSKKQMLKEIEKRKDEKISFIPEYNAQAMEISCVARTLDGKVTNLNTSWANPIFSEGMVRRTVELSFVCKSYKELLEIVEALQDMECRCLVRDMSASSNKNISTNIKLTFYESVDDTTNLSGIDINE